MMWLRAHCGRGGAYHGFSTPSLDAWAEFCRNAEEKDKSTHATLTRGSVCGSVAEFWATGPTAQGEWKGGYGVFRTELTLQSGSSRFELSPASVPKQLTLAHLTSVS